MAIQRTFTHPDTGEVSEQAHYVVADPLMRADTQQVVLAVRVFASKAAFDAGKRPVWRYERTFPQSDYLALRTSILNIVEPVLIARFFGGGVRVAD